MIFAKPTENGAGVELFGDYWDFKSLYSTISDLVDNSFIYPQLEDFVLSLAYDIRHSYQKNRIIESFGSDEFDNVEYIGFKSLWPHLLTQISLLRFAAGRKNTSKEMQANLYRLEFTAESALEEIMGAKAKEILDLYPTLSIINVDDYLIRFIDTKAEEFATKFDSKKKRIAKLPIILGSLSPISDDYKRFSEHLNDIAEEKDCSPHELMDPFHEWSDFKW